MAWLYDLSFWFFVLITAGALLASSLSLIVPALFSSTSNTGANVNWNVIAIVGSYVAIVCSRTMQGRFVLSRLRMLSYDRRLCP